MLLPPLRLIRSLLLMAAAFFGAAAAAQTATVDAVKAAYLQKIPLFAQWPEGSFADADSPLVVGVLGSDELFTELSRQVVGRKLAGRAMAVRRVSPAEPPDRLHLLYVGPEARAPSGWMEALLARHVLTVSDSPQGLAAWAVVNFRVRDERVRFEVSLEAAHKAGIKLSSRLLQVADQVQGGGS